MPESKTEKTQGITYIDAPLPATVLAEAYQMNAEWDRRHEVAQRTVGPARGALYAAQQIANRHRPTTRSGKPFCIECDYHPAPAGCPTWQLIGDVLAELRSSPGTRHGGSADGQS